MPDDSILISSEYIEYLIVGVETCTWIALMLAWLIGIPVANLEHINPLLAIIALPFAYPLGIVMDRLSYVVLFQARRLAILGLAKSTCKDELIAYRSEALYRAYEWRMRRVRIPGATAFNWLPLGVGILLYLGFDSFESHVVEVTAVLLTAVSLFAWASLYRRAYRFRQNACDIILGEIG
jgi:hypothetical protein